MYFDATKLTLETQAQLAVYQMLEQYAKHLPKKLDEVVYEELSMPDDDGPVKVSVLTLRPGAISYEQVPLVVGKLVYGAYANGNLWLQPKAGAFPEELHRLGDREDIVATQVYWMDGCRHVDLVRLARH